MVDPVADVAEPLLCLTKGSHGRAAAEYVVRIEVPQYALPANVEDEKSAELKRLFTAGGETETDDLIAVTAKYSSQQVRIGTRILPVDLVLVEHALTRIGFIASQQDAWSAKIVVDHQRAASGSIDFKSDVIALARLVGEKVHGCLRWPLAGPVEVYAQIDLAALTRGDGTLIQIEGAVNRFRFSVTSKVDGSRGAGLLSSTLTLTGKGLGRVALLLGRHWLKRALQRNFDEILSEAGIASFAEELVSARAELAETGGLAASIHEAIWSSVADVREKRHAEIESSPD